MPGRNHDRAGYHVSIGESGIVGTAAAVSDAVWHARGARVRELPVTLDRLLPGLP